MTMIIERSSTVRERVSSPPAARLSWKPAEAARGLLDGAWWPRSRDLTAELPALIDAMERLGRRVTRVTVNPACWPVVPRKVPIGGRLLHVGWFTKEQDPHKLMLLSYTGGRWDLLVVPPQTGAAAAARLMFAAVDPLRPGLTASRLISDEADHEAGAADEADHEADEADHKAEEDSGEDSNGDSNGDSVNAATGASGSGPGEEDEWEGEGGAAPSSLGKPAGPASPAQGM
ncbi:DUF5994 family protein [Wenjunlia tyrosinilytica]|uniref:Uncharacterized protein n=1 Tax=Wenjunlia tyrosinilytica TaxID=1544741 RepID=A0A917ZQ90_9ACTN|nr:DUF5994 family protein [Wenjunlia tyrosinilytica]GGO89397.1 hypothetical protein GCM10012280_32440 [Wenjunlia tyrosinilytica]